MNSVAAHEGSYLVSTPRLIEASTDGSSGRQAEHRNESDR